MTINLKVPGSMALTRPRKIRNMGRMENIEVKNIQKICEEGKERDSITLKNGFTSK